MTLFWDVILTSSPGDKDFYAAEEKWCDALKQRMAKAISRGATPKGAAVQCGVSITTFDRWYKDYDVFATFIDGCVEKRNSDKRQLINRDIKKVRDHEKRAKLRIQMLGHQDKEFSSKHDKLDINEQKDLIPPGDLADIDRTIEKHSIVDEAERIANDDTNG